MSNHFQQIKTMKNLIAVPDNMEKPQVLALLVHGADISHPAKDWGLHQKWTNLLLEEFFRQGDREAALGLPMSPLCDRSNTLVAESQIGFIDFIVDPTFNVLNESIEVMISSLQQQCASVSSDKDDIRTSASGDDVSLPRTPGPGNDLATPSTPKSPYFPVKVEQLKQSWTSCLEENKTRWKQMAAEDMCTAILPSQENALYQLDEKSLEEQDAVILLCDDDEEDGQECDDDDNNEEQEEEDEEEDDEEDEDDHRVCIYFDSDSSSDQLIRLPEASKSSEIESILRASVEGKFTF